MPARHAAEDAGGRQRSVGRPRTAPHAGEALRAGGTRSGRREERGGDFSMRTRTGQVRRVRPRGLGGGGGPPRPGSRDGPREALGPSRGLGQASAGPAGDPDRGEVRGRGSPRPSGTSRGHYKPRAAWLQAPSRKTAAPALVWHPPRNRRAIGGQSAVPQWPSAGIPGSSGGIPRASGGPPRGILGRARGPSRAIAKPSAALLGLSSRMDGPRSVLQSRVRGLSGRPPLAALLYPPIRDAADRWESGTHGPPGGGARAPPSRRRLQIVRKRTVASPTPEPGSGPTPSRPGQAATRSCDRARSPERLLAQRWAQRAQRWAAEYPRAVACSSSRKKIRWSGRILRAEAESRVWK